MKDVKMGDAKNQKEKTMYAEAAERMQMLGIKKEICKAFLTDKKLFKAYVDHDEKSAKYMELQEKESTLIQEWEQEKKNIVYYIIQDEGIWPDGCKFPRYTLLYVSPYAEEYKMDKESILKFETVPAYVINMEEPRHSEYTECKFQNIKGILVSLS